MCEYGFSFHVKPCKANVKDKAVKRKEPRKGSVKGQHTSSKLSTDPCTYVSHIQTLEMSPLNCIMVIVIDQFIS